jgi:hypothetical protein
MSKRIRHRHQRKRLYYRVIRPNGTEQTISAGQFIAGVAAGNLIRDSNDMRLARVRKWLEFSVDRKTRELIFRSARKDPMAEPSPTSIRPLLRKWLELERTLTADEARRKMRASLPRVDTETVRLY